MTTLANWEFAETLFDFHIPQLSSCLALTDPSPFQSIYVSHTTAEPNTTLVSGMTSSDLVFLHFAYSFRGH